MTHRADPTAVPPPTYLRQLADSVSAHLPTRVVGLSAAVLGRAVRASVGDRYAQFLGTLSDLPGVGLCGCLACDVGTAGLCGSFWC
jgi:hypothetical protein